jgi:hypothetical protein
MVARTALLASLGCRWAAATTNRRWTGYLGDAELRQSILAPDGFYGPNLWDRRGCLGAAATSNHQVFLPETRRNGTVAVPSRARDVDCYVRTRWRSFAANPLATESKGKKIGVTINGELQRVDPNTTISERVIRPYAKHFDVYVFLTIQGPRPKHTSNWHVHRFQGLPAYDEREERSVVEDLVDRFLNAGARGVEVHLYDLVRRPPQMPSKWSGANPGKSVVERFQLVWPSFALHMLVHSLVWSDVLTWERKHGQLNHIVKMRADAGWLGDAPVVGVDVDDSVALVKACASWGGLNDKMVLLPRRYADRWMDLLTAYYDDQTWQLHKCDQARTQRKLGYKNSEEFQLCVARLHHIPYKELGHELPVYDYYWWLRDEKGRKGCFPRNYAVVPRHTIMDGERYCWNVGQRSDMKCPSNTGVCERLKARLCPKV